MDPTITMPASPRAQLTSASTGKASILLRAADETRANIALMLEQGGRNGNAVFFAGSSSVRDMLSEPAAT
jgi:hypothetical protein